MTKNVWSASGDVGEAGVILPLCDFEALGGGRVAAPLVILPVAGAPVEGEAAAWRRHPEPVVQRRLLVVARGEVAGAERTLETKLEQHARAPEQTEQTVRVMADAKPSGGVARTRLHEAREAAPRGRR